MLELRDKTALFSYALLHLPSSIQAQPADFRQCSGEFIRKQCERIAQAVGGQHIESYNFAADHYTSFRVNDSSHTNGGVVMRTDPRTSALNRYQQCWAAHNVFVLGVSSFPNNAGYNPTMTISTQHLSDKDLAAIAEYLKSVDGSKTTPPPGIAASEPIMQRGAQVYELNCMACHNVKGEGLPGMVTGFADNPGIRTLSGANLVGTVLKGGQAVITEGNVTGAGMPSFDWKLSDSDIAAVLTYVRNSWGNAAPEVEAEAVTRTPEHLGLQPPMKNHF